MVYNKTTLNAYIQAQLNGGAGVYRSGNSPIEFVKVGSSLLFEDAGVSKEIAAGSFVSTDGDCTVYVSNMMTFVGRKQIVGYV
ncbi:MAG: hypothetical protein ACK5N8_02890 [Alphaproteobacteria bacterium]